MSDTPKGPSKDGDSLQSTLVMLKRIKEALPTVGLVEWQLGVGALEDAIERLSTPHTAGERVGVAVEITDAMIERACKRYAFREDGAVWPDAYSEYEVAAERALMREFLTHVLAQPPIATRSGAGPSEAAIEAAWRAYGWEKRPREDIISRLRDALTAAYAIDCPADPAPAARRDALVAVIAKWKSREIASHSAMIDIDAILSDSSGVGS